MDEIGLIKQLTVGVELSDSAEEAARANARVALLERTSPPSAPQPNRKPRTRRLLAFAGTSATAAAIAGILVLSSGPTAEPAAAEVLHETAAIAAVDAGNSEALPRPDQFLYTKTKSVGFDSRIPASDPTLGAASNAMLEISHETWLSPNGASRYRVATGAPRFLSGEEQEHWEEIGRPLPRGAFDPSDQDAIDRIVKKGGKVLETGRGLLDVEYPTPEEGRRPSIFGLLDVSGLPTDPTEFRRLVESHRVPALSLNVDMPDSEPLGREETISAIWGFLSLPTTTPTLRATAFNALAELPDLELDRDATDLVGREGSAIGYVEPLTGMHKEYIFDPETSQILGQRSTLVDPEKFTGGKDEGLPVGLTIQEIAYLGSGVVDSTHETVDSGPVVDDRPDLPQVGQFLHQLALDNERPRLRGLFL